MTKQLRRCGATPRSTQENFGNTGRRAASRLAERFMKRRIVRKGLALIPDRATTLSTRPRFKRTGRAAEAAREFALVERINTEFRSRTAKPKPQ